jgi:saccharopine dehydrogenase-like NADP-dependent oxidoreductase
MKKVIVLGAGLVGQAMAIDLCHDYEVASADMNPASLKPLGSQQPIRTIEADLSNPQTIKDIVADYDLVIGALPGFLGFQTLKAVIIGGKNIVDISFFDEDPFELDELAKHYQVTAAIDCGVAPGMGNIIVGYHSRKMQVDRFECLVGGLPVIRSWPYEYKAPFSPMDVIEEYTRPARMVENGSLVVKPALSDAEYVEFDQVGTLEAFNTDGLRTLLRTRVL